MDAPVDGGGYARRRRMAVVRHRRGGRSGWRPGAFPGPPGSRIGSKRGNRAVPEPEASLRAQAPLRIGAAFLGLRCFRPINFLSLPGHTITAFAMALSLSMFYPVMLIGLLFCALSVALSRILLGMHFLSDVLAGAAIGSALGYGAALLLG